MVRKEVLNQHVGWRLLLTTHAKLTKRIAKAMDAADCISYDTFDVLITLSEAPGHSMTMSDLAEATLFSNSGISRRVGTLEEKGLIQRDQCSSDGRVYHATLTKNGMQALNIAWPIYRDLIDEYFANVVSSTNAKHLVQMLRMVLSRLGEEGLNEVLRSEVTEEPFVDAEFRSQ